MQRKVTHIIFSVLLMVATTGVTFSMHYCGGKYVSTTISTKSNECCDGTGGCCENKTIEIKVKDDYESPAQLNTSKISELSILFPILFALNSELFTGENTTFTVFTDTSPPFPTQTRLALLQTYLC